MHRKTGMREPDGWQCAHWIRDNLTRIAKEAKAGRDLREAVLEAYHYASLPPCNTCVAAFEKAGWQPPHPPCAHSLWDVEVRLFKVIAEYDATIDATKAGAP